MENKVQPCFPRNLIDIMNDIVISCDKPYYDGFSSTNLLQSFSKGFMAERFVKPPVTLTIKLPCSVRIKSIVFHNTVGTFTSSSFEIMSYSIGPGREPSEYPIYKPIGKCYNTKPGVISFVNHRYKVDSNCNVSQSEQTYPLSSHDSTLLNSARFVAIRIIHTAGAGIPVLKDLAIIGYPLSNKFLKPPRKPASPNIEATVTTAPQQNDNDLDTTDSEQIPQDFIDPLTCQVMSLPVILPSGYTVDQNTLNRHVENEKSWGRKASDPFTGLPINESNPPILHNLLKERIDRYVLVNGVKAGRTTGKKRHLQSDDKDRHKCAIKRSNTASKSVQLNGVDSEAVVQTEPCQDLVPTNNKDSKISSRLSKILARTSNLRTVRIPQLEVVSCVSCGHIDRTDKVLYKLASCEHILCKSCLKSSGDDSVTCSKCSTVTLRSLVTRYHTA